MPKTSEPQAWAIEGTFQHLIYSPKGAIEGLLIDSEGAPTQFVTDPQDGSSLERLGALRAGQAVVVEGTEDKPSPKSPKSPKPSKAPKAPESPEASESTDGGTAHAVYRFQRLASVDGEDAGPPQRPAEVSGKVARFNYARHGEPNGFVLDSGDFVHTRPDGFAALGLAVGDDVHAEGPSRPLVDGSGRVVEAHRVNGTAVAAAH
ncbi:hypothetical protein GN316_18585 [Xylophilus sp. Kf1]|nr:hypothetical protein [Xylophilus sp. Kf1]